MIKSSIGFALLFTVLVSVGQAPFGSAYYFFTSELNEFEDTRYYNVLGDQVTIQRVEDGSLKPGLLSDLQDFTYEEYGIINRNNLLHTWTNTLDAGAWTETQTLYAFYTGNPYVYKAFHYRFVNNNSGEDCFDKETCFKVYNEGYLRLVANQLSSSISIGGSSNLNNKIKEVRVTNLTTEIHMTIQTSNGNINPPGSVNAYYFTDKNGKRYDLIGQFGWRGADSGGYGNWNSSSETSRDVILFFPRVTNPSDISTFNLKEGACSSGCWNFYDVSTGF